MLCEFVFVCARVCKGVQGCARVSKDVQGCVRMCKGVQGFATMCKNVQECARVCKGVTDRGLPCHPKWQHSTWIFIHFPLHVWLRDVLHKVYTYIFVPRMFLKQSAIGVPLKEGLLVT